MSKLTVDEADTLRLARSIIWDLCVDVERHDLAAYPAEVCAKLSTILQEKYDFDTGEVVEEAPPADAPSRVWVVRHYSFESEAADVLNALADDGYHIYKVEKEYNGGYVVYAFNPVLMQAKAQERMSTLLGSVPGGINLSSVLNSIR